MKKLISILSFCFIFLFIACDKAEIADTSKKVELASIFVLEEAYPGEGIIVTFKNGTEFRHIENVGYILGGDMILTEEQAVLFDEESIDESQPQTRGAIINKRTKLWIDYHPIPYRINGNTNGLRQKVLDAIAIWESKTELRFRELSDAEYLNKYVNPVVGYTPPYISFRSGSGNSSPVGKSYPGPNTITLDKTGSTVGTAVHEIGHSIGLMHEHQCWSRDDFIIVHTDNIIKNKRHNFTKESNHTTYNAIDFASIMLYPSYNNFAINSSQPTMSAKSHVPIPPKFQTGHGNNTWTAQRSFLSVTDRWAVAGAYGYYFNPLDHSFEEGGSMWLALP